MANIRKRGKEQGRGKSLIGRIQPYKRQQTKKAEAKEGFTVVNGRLVSANDVGVLLREATSVVEARKSLQNKGKNRNAKQRFANPIARELDSDRVNTSRGRTSKPTQNIKAIRTTQRKNNNRLVISTNKDTPENLLLFNNLALGVNHESLKSVLEKLSSANIAKVRVKDLPSGSATANVWLARPSSEELERVRKLFDGALVDGRTIRVQTVPQSSQSLSY